MPSHKHLKCFAITKNCINSIVPVWGVSVDVGKWTGLSQPNIRIKLHVANSSEMNCCSSTQGFSHLFSSSGAHYIIYNSLQCNLLDSITDKL
jgi:hypothetical protein